MVSLPIINIIIITVIPKNSIARICSLAYTHAPPPPCINHDERNHVINEKRESEAASSKESLEQCGKFLARPNGMGNLGRHLRRLSSPRIRFLRKSRQSKPDPTRLFHNLLVARTWRRRPNARAFRARTVEGRKCVPVEFVRRRHKDRGTRACMGRVWGEGEGEGEAGKWYFLGRSFDPPRQGGKNDRGGISDSSSRGRLEILGARRKSTRMRRQTREQLADYRYRWWINGCFSSAGSFSRWLIGN